jgi:hypothetical protein
LKLKRIVETGIDLLTCPDPRIITVCLEGLENILKVSLKLKSIVETGM